MIERGAAILLVVLVAWFAPHGDLDGVDSRVFLGVAETIQAGGMPYVDGWDHKPPLVYLIDAAALRWADVRTAERCFAVLAGIGLLAATVQVAANLWAGLVATLLALEVMFSPALEAGNMTEQYGAALLVCGLALALWERRGTAVAAGVCFGSAVLCKEPFILPAGVIVGWAAWEDWRRGAAMVAGAGVPLVLVGVWLWWGGALGAFVDVLGFNLRYGTGAGLLERAGRSFVEAYLRLGRVSHVAMVLALAGAWTCWRRGGWALLALVGLSFYAVSLGGKFYGHYYLMAVPAYAVAIAIGARAVFEREQS